MRNPLILFNRILLLLLEKWLVPEIVCEYLDFFLNYGNQNKIFNFFLAVAKEDLQVLNVKVKISFFLKICAIP